MRERRLDGWHRAQGAVFADGDLRHYGDPVREYRSARQAAALFDPSHRDLLLVAGADHLAFLQGVATHDIAGLEIGRAIEAAFITAKGKLVADARVVRLEDGLLFDLEAGRAAALIEHVERHRVNEDVVLQDLSSALVQLELWGPRSREALGLGSLGEGCSTAVELGGAAAVAAATAFGVLLFVPAAAAESAATELAERAAASGGGLAGSDAIEPARIELGLGRFGLDWDESTNPLEAGLDRAISYRKGCYVGQEVVAKATYVGHVNRRLVRLEWEGEPVPRGTLLLGGRSPGRVTSSAKVPGSTRTVALGYVRREASASGTRHRVGENEGAPEATVLGYPYLSREKPAG